MERKWTSQVCLLLSAVCVLTSAKHHKRSLTFCIIFVSFSTLLKNECLLSVKKCTVFGSKLLALFWPLLRRISSGTSSCATCLVTHEVVRLSFIIVHFWCTFGSHGNVHPFKKGPSNETLHFVCTLPCTTFPIDVSKIGSLVFCLLSRKPS